MAQPPDFKAVLREYIESLFLAILVAVILRTFVITAYKIPTPSMLPTLKVGDFIFAYKLPFGIDMPFSDKKWTTGQAPARGEIIVFRHPKDYTVSYIKRVVGLPGDKVEIRDNVLVINDKPVAREKLVEASVPEIQSRHSVYAEKLGDRTYAVVGFDELENFGPQIVPPQHVFVVGDNRGVSDDSRNWGTVPFEKIEGRVVMIWMSMDWVSKEDGLPKIRWDRLFQVPN